MTAAVSARLAGSPQSARTARALVRQALGDAHPSAADAELVVSELVGNAVAHSRSGEPGGYLTVVVEVGGDPSEICIRVGDAGAAGRPTVRTADADSEHGRGLGIVAALSADWGTEAGPTGRSTWCRLRAEPEPHGNPTSRRDQIRMPRAPREPNDRSKPNPYARGAFVVQINEALRGRIGQDGQPMADMWPEALHRTWRAEAQARAEAQQRELEEREAEAG